MTSKERIFHAVLFEAIALAVVVPVSAIVTGKGTSDIAIVGIGLSLFTVLWNYYYNMIFDRLFSQDRTQRSLSMRVAHALGFEGGLIFITVPVVAWYLSISLGSAMILEAGFLVFFFIYALAFNWWFDKYQPYKVVSAIIKQP